MSRFTLMHEEKFVTIILCAYLSILPLMKYGEYVFSLPRLNATAVILFSLTALMLWKIAFNPLAEKKYSWLELISILLLFIVLLAQIVQISILLFKVDSLLILKYISRTFFSAFLLFLLGRKLPKILSSRLDFLFYAWLISCFVYLYGWYISESVFIFLDGSLIYIDLADAFAILSLLLVFSISSKVYLRVLFIMICSFILFALVSRSSLFIFLLTFYLILIRKNIFLSLLFIALSCVCIFFFSSEIISILGEDNRMIRLFLEQEDQSLTVRNELMNSELLRLSENWLLGEFMYDVVFHGVSGKYSHNALSFISAYGFSPSIFMFIIICHFIFNSIFSKKLLKSPCVESFSAVCVFVIFSFLFTRGYTNTYIWLFIGSYPVFIKLLKEGYYD